jgi:hypothetical protein
MRTLDLNKVDSAAGKYYNNLKAENLVGEHDMIVFTADYEFRVANSSLVKISENPKNILRAYRIDSLGNLWVA